MLRFFRKTRKLLLDGGRVGTYLRYALGEIVLVVIGILIAIQVNNLNEGRREQRQIRQYAQALARDLRDDIDAIRVSAYQARMVVFRIGQLADYVQQTPFEKINNIGIYRYVWSLGYRPFAFNRAALSPMKGSGALRIMPNQELARKVSAYEAFTLHLEEDLTSDIQNARDAYMASNQVINRNFPGRAELDDYFSNATDDENFPATLLEFPSTELFRRVEQNGDTLICQDERELQRMVNVMISYANDLNPRPDIELPKLMESARNLIELIELEYPAE